MTILERLRTATGPDRNLDAMVHHFALDGVGTGNYADTPRYTGSIDAALALVERMLPGWSPSLDKKNEESWTTVLIGNVSNTEICHWVTDYGKTAPLAILTALFAALEAKENVE